MNGSWSFKSLLLFAAVNFSVAGLIATSANSVSPYDAVNRILSKRRVESALKAAQVAVPLSEAGGVEWKDKDQGMAKVSADLAFQVALKKARGPGAEARSSSVKVDALPEASADAPLLPNGPSGTNNVMFEQFRSSHGGPR